MDHCDIVSIIDYMIESTNKFIECRLDEHIKVVFQYLEYLQCSQYNFMNINSINNDCERHIYAFNINKQHFQFPMYDIGNMVSAAHILLTTLRNCKEYLIDIENRENKYGYEQVQDLIMSGLNGIIKKYTNFHKFLKIIERKPITVADLKLFFNNVVSVFNDKFEILKMFPCIDNIIYIYYYDVNRDFCKKLVTKMFIPQLQLTADVNLNICKVPTTVQSTIFSPAYNSFFNNKVPCFDQMTCKQPTIPTNTVSTTCSNVINKQGNYYIYEHTCHDYRCSGHGQHACHNSSCSMAKSSTLPTSASSCGASASYINYNTGCNTNYTSCNTGCNTSCNTECNTNTHLCHNYGCTLYGKHPCHSHICGNTNCMTPQIPPCKTVNVTYSDSHINGCHSIQPSGFEQCQSSTPYAVYTDLYEYDPLNSKYTYVYDPATCSHSHVYNPTANNHTHVYTTPTCVHTVIYDPSTCVHTHIYDPNICCHKYVYDSHHSYQDYINCGESLTFNKETIYDISNSSHTIVHDVSKCTYTVTNDCNTYTHTYDSSGCKYSIIYDEDSALHRVIYNPYICDHQTYYDTSLCAKIHIYVTEACTHHIVLDISDCIREYLVDMSGCIYSNTYDSQGCTAISKYNDLYADFESIVDTSYTTVKTYTTSNTIAKLTYDTEKALFTKQTVYDFEDIFTIDTSENSIVHTYDPSFCKHSSTEVITYRDTIIIDASDIVLESVIDPSLCVYNKKTHIDYENIYTIESEGCKSVTTYDPSQNIHITDKLYDYEYVHTYDASSTLLNIIFDPSHCTFTNTIKHMENIESDSSGIYVNTVVDPSDYTVETIYDFTKFVIMSSDDISSASFFDPSECTHIITTKRFTRHVDTIDTIYLKLEADYNPDICERSDSTEECGCYTIYSYDMSGCKYDICHNLLNCFHHVNYDPSLCTYADIDLMNGYRVATYTVDNEIFTVTYDTVQTNITVDGNYHYYSTINYTTTNFVVNDTVKDYQIFDISGLYYDVLYDPSGSVHTIIGNPEISGNIYTFDVSNCRHVITGNADISGNKYVFDVSTSPLDISTSLSVFTSDVYTFENYVATYNHLGSHHVIIGSPEISGNIYTFPHHTFNIIDRNINVDISTYTFDTSYVSTLDISNTMPYTWHIYDISDIRCEVLYDNSGIEIEISQDISTIDISHFDISLSGPLTSYHDTSFTIIDNTTYINRELFNICGLLYTVIYDSSQCTHTVQYASHIDEVVLPDNSGNIIYNFDDKHIFTIDTSFCTVDNSDNIYTFIINGTTDVSNVNNDFYTHTHTFTTDCHEYKVVHNDISATFIYDISHGDISSCRHLMLLDPSGATIDNSDNKYIATTFNKDVSYSLVHNIHTVKTEDLSVNGLHAKSIYDGSTLSTVLTYDPSLCDICNNTFYVDHLNVYIDGNVDICNNVATFDVSYTDISLTEVNSYHYWSLDTFDVSGIDHKVRYDLSTCKHTIKIDPSLCTVDISGNIYTFDVSDSTHVIMHNTVDISNNIYTFNALGQTDISTVDTSYNLYTHNYEMPGCNHQIMYDISMRKHAISYNTNQCDFAMKTDNSGNTILTYDVSDSRHTLIYDPHICTFTATCLGPEYVHTLQVDTSTTISYMMPEYCTYTHEFDISNCNYTTLHIGALEVTDISCCTHRHAFDICENDAKLANNDYTLVYDPEIHNLVQAHDASNCISSYQYATCSCVHILSYHYNTKVFRHDYNSHDCSHQHIFDLENLGSKYIYDPLTLKYMVSYHPTFCTHNDTHIYNITQSYNRPFIHYYPYTKKSCCSPCYTSTTTPNLYYIYGYKYMYGKMTWLHKYPQNKFSCDATDQYSHYQHDPRQGDAHGYIDTTCARVVTNPCQSKCGDDDSLYSKVHNPFYDAHLQKGIDFYSDSTWKDFVKIKYGMFDADIISALNQTEYVIYLGNDYVRFSEYDIKTDIFYDRLTSYTCKLYGIINTDFGGYQGTTELLSDNVFTEKKLIQYKCIYQEYLSLICLLQLDIENLMGLSLNDENLSGAIHTNNEGMMRNTCARFSKLYSDIKKGVIMNSDGTSFDVFYIDYNSNITFWSKNHNLTVTQFIVDEKIVKLVLSLDRAHVVLEQLNETYTKDMLCTLSRNNLIAINLFRVVMELNLKNIDDLLMKQYS